MQTAIATTQQRYEESIFSGSHGGHFHGQGSYRLRRFLFVLYTAFSGRVGWHSDRVPPFLPQSTWVNLR